jgi:urease accessory protein
MNFMPAIATIPAQRAVGRLDLAFAVVGGATRVQRFYQEGCSKARMPRAAGCEVVTINISGGVAGGDCLGLDLAVGPGARVSLASQAAERVYRALGPPSVISTRLQVGAGARLDYLPQETILFDRFGLERRLEVDLAANATFLGVESLVFGRRLMGETVRGGYLRDRITVTRGGKTVLRDMTRLEGDIAARLTRPAVANGAAAMACIVFAAPDAAARLAGLREVLARGGLTAGASAFDGIMVARILAPDGASLRHCMVPALNWLRDGDMPKVWGEG